MKKWRTKTECLEYIRDNDLETTPRYFGRDTWILKDPSVDGDMAPPPPMHKPPTRDAPPVASTETVETRTRTVRMKWMGASGSRPTRILELPVPMISKHEKTGEIEFSPESDVPVGVADALDRLLGKDSPFKRIDGSTPKPKQPIIDRCGFFESKNDCRDYITNQSGENKVMEKLLMDAEPVYMGFGRWAVTNHPIHDDEHEAVLA